VARDIAAEAERERARRYREQARECRAEAIKKTKDQTARPGLIQFALLCEMLADSIERRHAERTRPTKQARRRGVR
jgi:hypothetical protein